MTDREICIYTMPECVGCSVIKTHLTRAGVTFQERNLQTYIIDYPDAQANDLAAPVIVIDGQRVDARDLLCMVD